MSTPSNPSASYVIRLSQIAGNKLGDLRANLGNHPKISWSRVIELLVSHWDNSPPEADWVRKFEFQTASGRPRRKISTYTSPELPPGPESEPPDRSVDTE